MTAALLIFATAGTAWAQRAPRHAAHPPAAASHGGARCQGGQSFEQWLGGVRREAAAQGLSSRALAALDGLTFDQAIVNKDRGQGVFSQSFLQFSDRMAASYRLQQGIAHIRKNQALFQRIERQYGVPAAVITAFWGLETDYGANMGKLPTLRSLATLAYDCRRPDMFRAELIDALKLIDRGDLTPGEMVGAWAGEIGQTQFTPTYYVKYGVDYDGDGRADLRGSVPDVLASTANLLAGSGWQRGQPWLQDVAVPAEMAWQEADLSIRHSRAEWARAGVTLANGKPLPADALPASLLLPMGRLGPAFLAYPNFEVFLKWNQSFVYATTAAYFATRLAGAPPVRRGPGAPPPLNAGQIKEIQRILAKSGQPVGEIDGKLGSATRSAVRVAQLQLGMPADSYPTLDFLLKLRAR
jgi:lytic murein transglycosylase